MHGGQKCQDVNERPRGHGRTIPRIEMVVSQGDTQLSVVTVGFSQNRDIVDVLFFWTLLPTHGKSDFLNEQNMLGTLPR